jgi:hypothetical protein
MHELTITTYFKAIALWKNFLIFHIKSVPQYKHPHFWNAREVDEYILEKFLGWGTILQAG